ncbi:LPXTG-domain-containing protein cell wall anchor domain protein [Enterococcus durans]|uniref:LPXTG-domain-containing protein cell wall anchor domain protein n=1 Tax=Enterococcus durans TaxID=53345 RepID=A0A377KJT1_9ENTE|nr:VWA domain-containing protein [Enterococcus durans]STP29475.1 LPXTG-domain-containing protein cell wall anchor domain protein [Enterococcus durans]
MISNRMRSTNLVLVGIIGLFMILISTPVFAETYSFNYQKDTTGEYLKNGKTEGNTYNYNYGNAPDGKFDEEGYVNYSDIAYMKKSVQEVADEQGLFDVTLAVKGNQVNTPIDLVLVIDYSSSMNGEKLTNALKGLQVFGNELADSLADGMIRIGIVAYNRDVYSTNGFSTDINYLEDFLKNKVVSHSGTFMQKGLIEGQRMLLEESRLEAEKLFIHIGDNSANRSYLPVEGAAQYQNNGEIVDYNGYHTENYIKDYQTDSEKYYTTSNSSTDTNGIPVNSSVVTDTTLGTIVSVKESGFNCYSVATAPSARGEYIGRNITSKPENYLTTDENLSGLGSALTEIANRIDKTISNGTITDPMGENILLQGTGNFDSSQYKLSGWRKNRQGEWEKADDILDNVTVTETNQIITVENIALGENEQITLTYQVRINTESADFKGETWYLCNGRTTLTPDNESELLDFPIPSIKAPVVELDITKKWLNVEVADIPGSITFLLGRDTVSQSSSWQISDELTLSKEEGYHAVIKEVPINGQKVVLPKYNNNGEDFSYSIQETNVPTDFDSTVTSNENSFVITNTKKEPEPSTTEPSTTEPSTTEPSTTEPSTTEPSTTEPSTTDSSTTDSSTTEPSTTSSSITDSNTTGSSKRNTKDTIQIGIESSDDSEKGSLPKTNERKSSFIAFCGTILVGIIGYAFVRKIR